jgi:hypothetical protein
MYKKKIPNLNLLARTLFTHLPLLYTKGTAKIVSDEEPFARVMD